MGWEAEKDRGVEILLPCTFETTITHLLMPFATVFICNVVNSNMCGSVSV